MYTFERSVHITLQTLANEFILLPWILFDFDFDFDFSKSTETLENRKMVESGGRVVKGRRFRIFNER